MEGLAERTWRVLRSHGGAVLDLSSVVPLLRADGCAVTEWVLLRALESDRTRFLIVRPWHGRLNSLAGYLASRERASTPSETILTQHEGVVRPIGRVLVVVDPHANAGVVQAGPLLRAREPTPPGRVSPRVRRSLVLLGRTLDQHSMLDRIRWLRMLTEVAPQKAG
jgi:hypothetical protein